MLTTNLRFTQSLDPTGAARLADGSATPGPVTAAAYRSCVARPRTAASASRLSTIAGTTNGTPWSSIGLEAMPKVDFHDRWPLHSSS